MADRNRKPCGSLKPGDAVRTWTSGAGVDTTATVIAYLKGPIDELLEADLILIGDQEDPASLFLTNWRTDLAYPIVGTFRAASIERDKVTSQIGLQTSNMQIRWSPPLGNFTNNVNTTSPYQLAQIGYYDNKIVKVWRTVMPTVGDANTYGACEWYLGWVANSSVQRGKIVFNVNSFTNAFTQKVPQNTIESQSTRAAFAGPTPVLADSETSVPTFSVVAPSSAQLIHGVCIQPTAGKIYGTNKFQLGFIVFLAGSTLAGQWQAVARSGAYNPGGGLHYNEFQVYQPFPFDPSPGDTFYVATQPPTNDDGFDFVPAPELGI